MEETTNLLVASFSPLLSPIMRMLGGGKVGWDKSE